MKRTLVELCAGTAAISLRALAGTPVQTLVGYMGNKQRWAGEIVSLLGFGDRRPDEVVLVDGGPWGDVWTVLREREHRRATAARLREWDRGKPNELWTRLVTSVPYADPIERVCQYLWLQGRSAGTIPIWWNAEYRRGPDWNGKPDGAVLVDGEVVGRWESPTGSRTEAGHQRGGGAAANREKGSARGTRGGRAVEKGHGHHKAPGAALEASRKVAAACQAGGLAGGPRNPHAAGPAVSMGEDRKRDYTGPRALAAPRSRGPLYAARKRNHEGEPRRDRKVSIPNQVDASKEDVAEELAAAGIVSPRWKAGCRGIQHPATIAQRIDFLDALPWERVTVIHGDVRGVPPELDGRESRVSMVLDPPYRNAPRYAVLLPRDQVLDVARAWHATGHRVLVCEREPLLELGAGWFAARLPGPRRESVTGNFRFRLESAEQLPLWERP